MTSPLTREQQQALNELSNSIAAELRRGVPIEGVIANLVRDGWTRDDAQAAVLRVESQVRSTYPSSQAPYRAEARKAAMRHLTIGALWFFGGLIVTIATLAAAEGGGTYIVAWGAILFGLIDMIRGAIGLMTDR